MSAVRGSTPRRTSRHRTMRESAWAAMILRAPASRESLIGCAINRTKKSPAGESARPLWLGSSPPMGGDMNQGRLRPRHVRSDDDGRVPVFLFTAAALAVAGKGTPGAEDQCQTEQGNRQGRDGTLAHSGITQWLVVLCSAAVASAAHEEKVGHGNRIATLGSSWIGKRAARLPLALPLRLKTAHPEPRIGPG